MGEMWRKLNHILFHLSHDYLLITLGAILFFVIQAYIGYRTYRHFDRKLQTLENMIQKLSTRVK